MPVFKYTQEQIDRVIDLRYEGHTYKQIEDITGMPNKTVSWHCMRAGVFVPTREGVALLGTNPSKHNRKETKNRRGTQIRPYTPEDDRIVKEMRMEGETLNAIARRLGRSNSSVINRLYILARVEGVREEMEEEGI